MSLVADTFAWFTTAAHWRGTDGVPHRVVEHVFLSALAVAVAGVLALPAGVWLGHRRRGSGLALAVAGLGRAIPQFGLLVLAVEAFGLGGWPGFGARPALFALVVLAVPPMFTNACVAVAEVDPDVVDAARGMGLTERQVLGRVELPLAWPLVLAGIRSAAVQVVATATLAAAVAWGGLGRFIVDGFARRDSPQLVAGALLVAALAVLTDLAFGAVGTLRRAQEGRSSTRLRRQPTKGLEG